MSSRATAYKRSCATYRNNRASCPGGVHIIGDYPLSLRNILMMNTKITLSLQYNYSPRWYRWSRAGIQCRKFEGNLAEASAEGASRSCGRGSGGLFLFFVCLLLVKFSRGSCRGCLNAIYGPGIYLSAKTRIGYPLVFNPTSGVYKSREWNW